VSQTTSVQFPAAEQARIADLVHALGYAFHEGFQTTEARDALVQEVRRRLFTEGRFYALSVVGPATCQATLHPFAELLFHELIAIVQRPDLDDATKMSRVLETLQMAGF
jgi:hypothetical protein